MGYALLKTYCFDFDGVICNIDSDNYWERTPIHQTIEIMHSIKNLGGKIIIHTGRHILMADASMDWLKKYKVPFDLIQFGKPVADVYIDDKALRIEGTWTQKDIESLR